MQFNWRIITSQYCDGFCHTSTWIGHRYTCAPPSWTLLPPPSPHCPSGLSQSTSFECPTSCIKLPLVIYFQFSSVAQSCPTLCNPMDPQHVRPPCPSPTPGLCPNSCPLSWWCHPTILSCYPLLVLPSIFPSIRVFSKESALRIRWPKYWSFSFIISPSNEYSGLITFRIDWFDLLAVQGTLKSLLQHHCSKALGI